MVSVVGKRSGREAEWWGGDMAGRRIGGEANWRGGGEKLRRSTRECRRVG